MTPEELPVVGVVCEFGADDHLFDLLVLAGPPVILYLAVAGRSVPSEAAAVLYVCAFLGNVLYRGLAR
ncbi:MAG: hypothetical protein ABEJ82_05935 [Haloplanus sp.]